MLIKLLVCAFMLSIVFCLTSGVLYLLRGQGDSKHMLKALSWRIGLSLLLFILLLLAYAGGFISPHALG